MPNRKPSWEAKTGGNFVAWYFLAILIGAFVIMIVLSVPNIMVQLST